MVKRMAGSVVESKRATLQICVKAYEAAHDKTKGFTVLPKDVTLENIASELDTIAGVIRSNYDPDK